MNTIVRIKFLFYLTFFLLVGNVQLYAQQKLKFAVESFEQDPFDTSARDKQYEKVDGSGSRYAIIKVSSTNPDDELKEYRFNFGNLRSSVVEHDNELWIYVQRNAKMVTISRPGYVTLNRYDLQTTIEAGKNYILTLSSAGKRVLMQMVQFNVTPADSKAVVTIKKSTQGAQEELFGYVNLLLVRLADAHVVSGRAVRTHAGIYDQKAIVGNLRANLLSALVLHDIGLALLWVGIAQLRLHLAHAERDEFRARGGSWIADHDGSLLSMAVARTCQRHEHHQAPGRDALHHFSMNLFHFDLFVFYLIRMNSC